MGLDELLSLLIFESFNVSSSSKWLALEKRANLKTIGRQEYVEQCAKLEFLSGQNTWCFFTKVWLPLSSAKGFPVQEDAWIRMNFASSFPEWKSTWSPDGYPYNVYGNYYDRL